MMDLFVSNIETPIGLLQAVSDGNSLLKLSSQPLDLEERHCVFLDQVREWLDVYFSRKDPGPAPSTLPQGSAFQLRVWQELIHIPFGGLTTYGAIAQTIGTEQGKRMSAQAVGGAVGRNPILILIPCHRVIGASGALTGFSAGMEKKVILLENEGHPVRNFSLACNG